MQQAGDWLKEDRAVWIVGRIDAREEEAPKILPDAIYPLDEKHLESVQQAMQGARSGQHGGNYRRDDMPPQQAEAMPMGVCRRRLFLRVNSMEDPRLEQVKPLLISHRGDLPVILFCADTRKSLRAPRSMWVYNNLLLIEKLRFILGEENVIMK